MWRFAASLILGVLFVPCALAELKNVLILHEGSRLLTYQYLLSSEMQKDLASTQFDIQVFERVSGQLAPQSGPEVLLSGRWRQSTPGSNLMS